MKTKFDNKELAHVWAQQKQESGRGSNMFFEGAKIYSYGHHFCIANFVKPDVILFNSNGYSKTTSKHKSFVSRAIHSAKVFTVPSVDFELRFKGDSKKAHEVNTEYFKKQIFIAIEAAKTSNKYSELEVLNAQRLSETGLDYCNTFGLSKALKNWFAKPIEISDKLQARIDGQKEKAKTLADRIAKEQAKKLEAVVSIVLPNWLNGIDTPKEVCSYRVDTLPNSYLRLIDKDVIETSHGAKVNVRNAKALFSLIKAGKDIKGFEIDGYTVLGINGVLTVGCHRIERTEINRFASLMGWGQIENH
jgi:hypothetical protein